MAFHCDQDELITEVLSQIANESHKSVERVKRLLLIKQNPVFIQRFWGILDNLLPGHRYQYFGCCGECGTFELREDPPF